MFNTNVTRKSYGVKGTNPDRFNSLSMLSRKRYQEQQAAVQESAVKSEVDNELKIAQVKEANSRVVLARVNESQILKATNRLYNQGKEMVFSDIVAEAYLGSLYLDEDFILEQENALRAEVNKYVTENGGFKLLESAIQRTNSPFLKRIKVLCEATAKKVADRKSQLMREGDVDPSTVDFSFTEEEKEDFDYEKGTHGLDQVSQLVKDKVLNTVMEEKERQKREEEFEKELEDATSENDDEAASNLDDSDVVEDEAAKESQMVFNSIFEQDGDNDEDDEILPDDEFVDESKKTARKRKQAKVLELNKGLRESTLFDSIMQSVLKESVASRLSSFGPHHGDPDDEDGTTDVNLTAEDVMKSEYKGDDSLKGEQRTHPLSATNIDMDLVLAESVARYTLFEVAHTLQLQEFTHDSVRDMSRKLLA